MKTYQFKELDIKPEGSWLIRTLKSAHFKKTIVVALTGAIVGYALFYFSLPTDSNAFWGDEALTNMMMGFAFGVFFTNNPCARGRC